MVLLMMITLCGLRLKKKNLTYFLSLVAFACCGKAVQDTGDNYRLQVSLSLDLKDHRVPSSCCFRTGHLGPSWRTPPHNLDLFLDNPFSHTPTCKYFPVLTITLGHLFAIENDRK